jgi:hypothetical protein
VPFVPPRPPKPNIVLSPGYGAAEGWADDSILRAWADGVVVSGGLRSKLNTGDQVFLKITILTIDTFPDKASNPNYIPPQDNAYFLKYDSNTNQGAFVNLNMCDAATCVHKIVFAEDNAQFQNYANQNNMGIAARRNMFALMNNNGQYLTVSNETTTYANGMWPNNQPGPTQMFNWNDFSGFSIPSYPFGPYCPGAGGVIVRREDGYIRFAGNYSVRQIMEVITVDTAYSESPPTGSGQSKFTNYWI